MWAMGVGYTVIPGVHAVGCVLPVAPRRARCRALGASAGGYELRSGMRPCPLLGARPYASDPASPSQSVMRFPVHLELSRAARAQSRDFVEGFASLSSNLGTLLKVFAYRLSRPPESASSTCAFLRGCARSTRPLRQNLQQSAEVCHGLPETFSKPVRFAHRLAGHMWNVAEDGAPPVGLPASPGTIVQDWYEVPRTQRMRP